MYFLLYCGYIYINNEMQKPTTVDIGMAMHIDRFRMIKLIK